MPIAFAISAVLVVAWIVTFALASAREGRERARFEEESLAAVRESTGLELAPELLVGVNVGSYSGRGTVRGLEVEVHVQRTVELPGATPSEDSALVVTTVSCPTTWPDQIVCRRTDADRVMGPLPSVRPRPTGSADFDAQYAIFVTPTAPSDAGGGYRDAPDELGWADPETVTELLRQRLVFARVKDGRCELAFPTGPVHALGALVAATARFGRGPSWTEPLRGLRDVALRRRYDEARSRLLPAIVVALFAGPLVGPLLAMTPPFRALAAPTLCGQGVELLGGDEGFRCTNGVDAAAAHVGSAIALVVGVAFGVFWLRAMLRWPR